MYDSEEKEGELNVICITMVGDGEDISSHWKCVYGGKEKMSEYWALMDTTMNRLPDY